MVQPQRPRRIPEVSRPSRPPLVFFLRHRRPFSVDAPAASGVLFYCRKKTMPEYYLCVIASTGKITYEQELSAQRHAQADAQAQLATLSTQVETLTRLLGATLAANSQSVAHDKQKAG
jgi:hypothetical protein